MLVYISACLVIFGSAVNGQNAQQCIDSSNCSMSWKTIADECAAELGIPDPENNLVKPMREIFMQMEKRVKAQNLTGRDLDRAMIAMASHPDFYNTTSNMCHIGAILLSCGLQKIKALNCTFLSLPPVMDRPVVRYSKLAHATIRVEECVTVIDLIRDVYRHHIKTAYEPCLSGRAIFALYYRNGFEIEFESEQNGGAHTKLNLIVHSGSL